MPNEKWQARVKEAQQKAAQRLGVDVSIMKPPRQPSADGSVEATPEAATPEASGAATATKTATAPVSKAVEAPPPASLSISPAARRIAEAKARAAANGRTNGSAAAVAKPAPAPIPATVDEEEEEVGQEGINRREFLSYAWGAALGLLTVESGAATYFFMYPRFRAGEFGGKFDLGDATILPAPDAAPTAEPTGKFWLVDTEAGPRALYMVCTHLGCLYKWEPSNFRFECPCHGSKFSHDGNYIEGPAPRSLDQFVVEVVENGQIVSTTERTDEAIVPPVVSSPNVQIVVDTGSRVQGLPAATSPDRAES